MPVPDNENAAGYSTSLSCSPSTASPPKGRGSNNNPTGRNQHKNCPPADDPRIPQLLQGYHRRGINDKRRLSELLLSEHNIKMSDSTVARRRRELGLRASHLTTKEVSDTVKRQLVLDQLAKDPAGRIGPRTVKLGIFQDAGIDLTRDWIANEMRVLAPAAYASRGPAHNKGRVNPPAQAAPSGAAQVSPPAAAAAPPPAHAPPIFTSTPGVMPSIQTRPESRAPDHPPPIEVDSDSDMSDYHFSGIDGPALHSTPTHPLRPQPPPNYHAPHPAQAGLSQLARELALPDAPRPHPGADDQTFGLVFDVLERATPTVVTLGHFLTGVAPGNAREHAVVAAFRAQLRVLDGQLARMAGGGAG